MESGKCALYNLMWNSQPVDRLRRGWDFSPNSQDPLDFFRRESEWNLSEFNSVSFYTLFPVIALSAAQARFTDYSRWLRSPVLWSDRNARRGNPTASESLPPNDAPVPAKTPALSASDISWGSSVKSASAAARKDLFAGDQVSAGCFLRLQPPPEASTAVYRSAGGKYILHCILLQCKPSPKSHLFHSSSVVYRYSITKRFAI